MPSKLETRIIPHDREIAAIRMLILQGMKMLVENGTQIKALAAAQRATDKKLDALSATVDGFIRSLERGGAHGQKADNRLIALP